MNKIDINKIIGKQFNLLKVISFIKKIKRLKSYNYYYRCLCKCGNFTVITRRALISNHTKSCGCLKKSNPKMRKKFGENSMNSLYYQYKSGAKQRKIEFTLTKEQFKQLTKMNCYYCKIKPKQKFHANKAFGYYLHNGID